MQALGFEIQVERLRVHDLCLSSGELMLFDPLGSPESEHLPNAFSPGVFPVYVLVADLRDERKPAYLTVQFSEAEVKHWSSAYGEADDEGGHLSIESNLIGLMDASLAHPWLSEVSMESGEELEKRLFREIRRSGSVWSGAYALAPLRKEKLVLAVVEPGPFEVWIGRDDCQSPVMLACDLGVLDFRFHGRFRR